MTLAIAVQPTTEPGAVLLTDSLMQIQSERGTKALLHLTPRFERVGAHGVGVVSGVFAASTNPVTDESEFEAAVADLWPKMVAAQSPAGWSFTSGATSASSSLMAVGGAPGSNPGVVWLSNARTGAVEERRSSTGCVFIGAAAAWWADHRITVPDPPSTLTQARDLALELGRQFIAYVYGGRSLDEMLAQRGVPMVAPPYWIATVTPSAISIEKVME